MHFKLNLKTVRVLRGRRQIDLWATTGIQMSKISRIENGLIQPTELEKEKLAKALGVKVTEIWNE